MDTQFDIPADLHTPVSAFLRLEPFAPRYLLESVEAGHLGRYSFIGFGPSKSVTLDRTGGPGRPGVLDELRTGLGDSPVLAPGPAGQPFAGGLVGVAAFDLVRELYRLPRAPHPSPFPTAAYMITESVLVFDHLSRRVALLHAGSDAERQNLKAEVQQRLRGPLVAKGSAPRHQRPTPSMSRDRFEAAVRKAKSHITAGDIYQLVLSIKFTGETTLDPFQTYRALRLLNPSPYMYFLDFGELQVVGSSPEALTRLNGRVAELRPIAGTRPRGADEERDRELERQLLADSKEAAEHVMLVDLARNDLGRAAVPGSITVEPYRVIERYSHVMHLVSGVSGTLRPDLDAFDLFAAAFPAGTVTGAPKLRAIELIDEIEPVNRDLYAGTVGYFGHGGSMDQAITIRTVLFHGDRYAYQAGAGIVADSDPSREHLEILAKAAAMEAAFQLAEEGV